MSGILNFIWTWVGPLLIKLAIEVGMPAATEWIVKKLPWLSADSVEKIIKAIVDAISGIKEVKADEDMTKEEKKMEIRAIKRAAVRECQGVACPTDTKKNF